MKGDATHHGPLFHFMKLMLAVAGVALGAGLVLYVSAPDGVLAPVFLVTGLLALMSTPLVRILLAIADAAGRRDFQCVGFATLVVLELALTIWYASTRVHP